MTSREWQDMDGEVFADMMTRPWVMWWEKAVAFVVRIALCMFGVVVVDAVIAVLDRWLPLE